MNILIALTSQDTIGNSDIKTGFHFSEFSHPYKFFTDHGYKVTVASPKGGECPITSPHPEDKINAEYYQNPVKMKIIKNTIKLSDIVKDNFNAVYLAGGHGTMFDLPDNPNLAKIINRTYSDGGILASVCHGAAGFIGVKDKHGEFLVANKKINCFSNAEEKLIEQGAVYESSGIREAHLAVDKRFVTGQNPESIGMVIGAIQALMQEN